MPNLPKWNPKKEADNPSVAILFIQMRADKNSRTWIYFTNQRDAIDGFLRVLWDFPKKEKHHETAFDAFGFIYTISEMVLLEYEPNEKNSILMEKTGL